MNAMRKKSIVILSLGAALLVILVGGIWSPRQTSTPKSCTAFAITSGDAVLMGNNEDSSNTNGRIGFYPPTEGTYGFVEIGYLVTNDGDTYVSYQGGMNHKGLAWDALGIPEADLNPHPERPYAFWDDNFLGKILKEHSTVAGVIDMASEFDFGESMGMQILVADATGDAVVIGPGPDGEVAFTRKAPGEGFLVSVNANQTDPDLQEDERYNTVVEMLGKFGPGERLGGEDLAPTLEAASLKNVFNALDSRYTAYSYIFDLRKGLFYIYYLGQYNEVVEYDLIFELNKGKERVIPITDRMSKETVDDGLAQYEAAHSRADNIMNTGLWAVLLALGSVVYFGYRRITRGPKRELSERDEADRQAKLKPTRFLALDLLRGLIMIFMALDHANHFIAHGHSTGEYWGGKFPAYQDGLAFLTRFITHFSAPGFFFLMGVGMALFAASRRERGWWERDIRRHFLARGFVLIALQFLVVNRIWKLHPDGFYDFYFGVLFALGGAMILGSLLLKLKPKFLLGMSLALLIVGEFLPPDPMLWGKIIYTDFFDYLKLMLIHPGGTGGLMSNYPILPWLGLVTFGMAFGAWLRADSREAFKRALWIGGAFLLGFVVLRAFDGFGNIRPREGNTWIDFLNLVKYPPSITFILLTMGVNLAVLGALSRLNEVGQRILQPVAVIGRAPLFFYLLHLIQYAGLGLWLTPEGTSLTVMYFYWLACFISFYPLCLWYGRFKHRQPVDSLLRFF